MIPKSIMTLEGARVAANPLFWIVLNADGTINFNETRGTITVFCNKRDRKGEQHSDVFELLVSGEKNLTTVATHVAKGKELHRVTCFVTIAKDAALKLDQNGNVVKDKNGQPVKIDVPRYYVQLMELGADSVNAEKERTVKALQAMRAQGTLPPHITDADVELILNTHNQVRANKAKNAAFNLALAQQTGKWGNASLWSKDKGHWAPNGGQPVAQNVAATGGVTPEALAQALQMLANQNAQQTAAAGGTPPAGGGDVWENPGNDEIPF